MVLVLSFTYIFSRTFICMYVVHLFAFACFFVTVLRGKLSTLYRSLSRAEAEKNSSMVESDKKLRMCYHQANDLRSGNSLLQKGMKNLSLISIKLQKEKERLTWVLKSRKIVLFLKILFRSVLITCSFCLPPKGTDGMTNSLGLVVWIMCSVVATIQWRSNGGGGGNWGHTP